MASEIHVKAKKAWKKIDISTAGFSQKDLADFISLEELTDYKIVKKSLGGIQKKNTSDEEQTYDDDNLKESTKKGRKEIKKKKRKQKQETLTDSDLKQSDNERKDKSFKKKENKRKPVDKWVIEGKKQIIEDVNQLMEFGQRVADKDAGKQGQKKGNKRKSQEKIQGPNKKVKLEETKSQPDSIGDSDEEKDDKKQITKINKSLKGMEAWKDLFVPDEVLWALRDQGFTVPTPIQTQVLPAAIRDKMDIVGAAETGSGKTLAFGIPVLHFILQQKQRQLEKLEEEDEEADSEAVDDSDSSSETGDVQHDEQDDNTDDENKNYQDKDDKEEDSGYINEEEDDDDNDDDYDDDDDSNNERDVNDSNELETADTGSCEEESSDDEAEDLQLQPDGRGCVKVIKDVDFSWLEEVQDVKEAVQPQFTHPQALILEPTRELAIQVKNHLQAAAKYTDVKVAVIVGGLSVQKQQRILKKHPHILVATPGRLWELIQQGEVYLSEIEKTGHLVIDEADRMIEKGHFEELTKLLERMKRDPGKENRHTYVFSATLTLIHSGPNRVVKKKKKNWDEKQKLYYLMRKMGLKPKPKVIDITRKMGTVETLTEAKINCTKEDKDIYLYYFLKHYPGRTLVFTNSKDCIRRLVSIFTLLQCNPLPLHADMHQRQRLKNLDKFSGNPKAVLIASDVAARGLDIPNVQHVIHYQVPHTVENYVHRSGRTARASKEGLSIMLIGPDDVKNYRKIIHTLNKSEDLPPFPVEQQILPEIKHRVNIVRKIETQEYRFKKSKRENDWFRKAAEEAGVDIEDEGLLNDLGDNSEQQQQTQHIKQMKQELGLLLRQPLQTRSSFTKYPTMSGKLLMPPANEDTRDALSHVKKKRKNPEDVDKQVNNTATSPEKTESKKKNKWRKKKKKVVAT